MSHAYCMKAYLSQWQRLHSASAPPVYMSESQRSYGQCMQTGTAQQQVPGSNQYLVVTSTGTFRKVSCSCWKIADLLRFGSRSLLAKSDNV